MTSPTSAPCHLCAQGRVRVLDRFSSLPRVTSDCKPWPAGGILGICDSCGTTQKAIDEKWASECRQIYSAYTMYDQAAGVESGVFDETSGMPTLRSQRLLQQLLTSRLLPPKGRALDIGCGNGALLRSASLLLGGWTLAGTEMSDKFRTAVEGIPRVEKLYTCPLGEVPGRFDLITLLHVLEHIPNPVRYLSAALEKLEPEGRLLIEVPDFRQNPFDLLISDHCSHFSRDTVERTLQAAGYGIVESTTAWIPKEISVVAHGRSSRPALPPASAAPSGAEADVDWLHSTLELARLLCRSGPLGLFGTSIAATWLTGELGSQVAYFVDEDPHRVDRTHLGRPILHPRNVPRDAKVFMALAPAAAHNIRIRMENSSWGGSWIEPPARSQGGC